MSQEDYPIEFVLDSLDSIMPPSKQPKVLLFDIGGVCVVSPFQAILNYELSHSIPPGWINTSISSSAPNGHWHRLERGELTLSPSFFAGFNHDLRNPVHWSTFYTKARLTNPSLPATLPPIPEIDGEYLFFEMMRASRAADPWMFPALKALKESGRYLVAALSNTVIFPPEYEHRFADLTSAQSSGEDVRSIFEVFISSAHVGMRKPNRDIYDYALKEIDAYARENASGRGAGLGWEDGVRADEVVFLDDIGENLKAGKKAGFGTIKVHLGKAFEAVDELEDLTGLKLAGDHPRIAIKPIIKKPGKAKL